MANTGQQLKYGWIRGPHAITYPVPIGNAEVISAKSGRFVKNDASGRAEVAVAGTTLLWGFLESEAIAAADNDAEGKYTRNLIDARSPEVYRIPFRYDNSTYDRNYSAALLGESCDLVVISDIQYANLSASLTDVIIIVGGQAASSATANDGYVDVIVNLEKLTSITGVE